ncbi:MAG: magnesium transporter [Xanthomonadales bacterium]|nr:magnesium transporter [Xanthomonadales bacterium]
MTLPETLRASFLEKHPAAAARAVEASPELAADIVDLPFTSLLPFFDRIDPLSLREVFLTMPEARRGPLLEALSIRTALTLLRALTDEERDETLAVLPEASRRELRNLLDFPYGTAGGYMDRPIAQFRTGMTVGEALERLRLSRQRRTRSLYVVDEDGRLEGRVDMQDMALATRDERLAGLLQSVEGVASLTAPREELVAIFDQTRVDSIPVIDSEGLLVGVVRSASLFQAVEDEASVDIQTMVGASADERALSSPGFAVRKRLPWLHINLLTAFLAAAVVGLFESIIAQFTALAILLPVVAGQSGNAGSQALAVTMRGLALKEVSILHWRRVLGKEVWIGIIDGVALAVTCGLGVFVWSQSLGLAIVIGIAMVCSMIAAGISGALVPMILIRLGQDPATASSIILTTVTDVAGFLSFLGTATLLAFLL